MQTLFQCDWTLPVQIIATEEGLSLNPFRGSLDDIKNALQKHKNIIVKAAERYTVHKTEKELVVCRVKEILTPENPTEIALGLDDDDQWKEPTEERVWYFLKAGMLSSNYIELCFYLH